MILRVFNLEAGYGKKQVLFGTSLEVQAGEIVAIIGPNGAGKSTLLKAIVGLIPAWNGEVEFDGTRVRGDGPAKNIVRGMAFAPQGNRVFDDLTTMENLEIGGFNLPPKVMKERIAQAFHLFPVLRKRARQDASKLSGGEQQILALARILIPRPKLLLLDEPSLGLSPSLVNTVFSKIAEISRETGVAVLIVEQKVKEVLSIAGRAYGMRLGRVEVHGSPQEVFAGDTLKRLFLG